jgi:hypothetical protein
MPQASDETILYLGSVQWSSFAQAAPTAAPFDLAPCAAGKPLTAQPGLGRGYTSILSHPRVSASYIYLDVLSALERGSSQFMTPESRRCLVSDSSVEPTAGAAAA